MAMELKQTLKLTQQLVMTPQLQQAIKLLQLSRLELVQTVRLEMLENPVLEEVSEDSDLSQDDGLDGEPKEAPDSVDDADDRGSISGEIDWETFIDNYQSGTYDHNERDFSGKEETSFENTTSRALTLAEHLIWQLRMSNVTLDEEQVGGHIIGNLDDDGYLKVELIEIAEECGQDIQFIENTLKKVQEFDPPGVAARDLRECLLLQAYNLGLHGSVVEKILKNTFEELERKDVNTISKKLKVSSEKVLEALRIISDMEPKPGRPFGEDRTHYITPDIFIHKIGDDYVVVLNDDGMPKLRISNYYRRLLKGEKAGNEITRNYVKDKLKSAMWLIKSIHQRQRTISKVTKSIVKFHREFLDNGISHLKPLVLKDVANDINMHESTVSRVTTNKYVHTPQGTYELKFFFNSGINTVEGGTIAAESVKGRIQQIINSEPPAKPYSDQTIVRLLRERNISIARRTVTKYREMMGLLSSNRRKRTF